MGLEAGASWYAFPSDAWERGKIACCKWGVFDRESYRGNAESLAAMKEYFFDYQHRDHNTNKHNAIKDGV